MCKPKNKINFFLIASCQPGFAGDLCQVDYRGNSTSERRFSYATSSDDDDDLPVWALALIVTVCLLCLIIVIIVAALLKYRR